MNQSFTKKVSKGSRFNQVYIPRESTIEVGDLVQVTLLKKHTILNYKNLLKLNDFKEYIIKGIFSSLQEFTDIKSVFIVGSFLFETIDYNDIDIIITTDKENKEFEKDIDRLLTNKFNQKFHILSFSEEKLKTLIEKDPLTRAMFNSYISNSEINLSYKRIIDEKHIKFLLMMPEDLLELRLPSRVFYDNLRRLITITQFLQNNPLDRNIILKKTKDILSMDLFSKIKNNEEINDNEIRILRKIIKENVIRIRGMLNG